MGSRAYCMEDDICNSTLANNHTCDWWVLSCNVHFNLVFVTVTNGDDGDERNFVIMKRVMPTT